MAFNLVGKVSQIVKEVGTRKDQTTYDKYKVVIATKNKDNSVKFLDVPVYLTKNVDMSIIDSKPIEVTSGWLSTNGESVQIVINGIKLPDQKDDADVPF